MLGDNIFWRGLFGSRSCVCCCAENSRNSSINNRADNRSGTAKPFFLLFYLFLLSSFSSYAGQLNATLQDSVSGAPIAGQKVVAYELDADNNKKWRASRHSDDNGQVSFELENLGSGGQYFLMAKVYNNFKVYSEVKTEPGELLMSFGSTQINVLNGTVPEHTAMVDTKVYIYKLNGEEKSWFATAYTDAQGMLKVDLPDIDNGQNYLLGSASPVSGQRKYSEPLTSTGSHQFVVGNIPLNVTMVDGISAAAISDTRIDVYYYDSEGKRRWYARSNSDSEGKAQFDLQGLGSGTTYVLKSKVYNGAATYSVPLTNHGDYTFKVGTSLIEVLDGSVSPNVPLAGRKVWVHKLLADGSKEYFARYNTDQNGQVRLNLPDVANGQQYMTKAKSPIDESTIYEQTISAAGKVTLTVGSMPLKVTLTDALNGQALPGKEISAYERFADGSKKRVSKRVTDGAGLASFDLPQIGSGRNYYLAVKGFDDFRSYTPILTAAGDYAFAVGSTRVTLKDGSQASQPVLPNQKVSVYKIVDGKNKSFGSSTTDAAGQIRLDLPELSQGQQYRLRALSQVNQSKKYSDVISQTGDMTFVVGNPAVSVKVFNILDNTLYADEKVTAYWLDEAGQKQWYQRLVTGSDGIALFDLDKINQGREYFFKVSKFSTGYTYSRTISQSGHLDFGIGAVPVTLMDKENGSRFSGVKVIAYKILDDGKLKWDRKGYTDSAGQLTFDLSQLQQGQRYTFKAKNPYGEGKTYYGPIISGIGPVTFVIKQGEYGKLDLDAPVVAIDTPDQDNANSAGFTVAGSVSDNQQVDRVEVSIGSNQTVAVLDSANGRWQAEIPAAWVSGQTSVEIVARGFDAAQNNSAVTRVYAIVDDAEDPVIAILSHQNLQQVNTTGFTVLGTVTDDVQVASITATLVDPILGETISAQSLNIATVTGQWALPVTNGKVSDGQTVQIVLRATDINNKTATAELLLNAVSVSNNPVQLATRITFGLTPDLLNRIQNGEDYLAEQLNPESIDDSVFEQAMAARSITERQELRDYLLSYMVGSKKQLREIMAWFWENHFSTNINSHGSVAYELAENNLFRQHALGNFRDLLSASAKSAAMIEYLNNQQNVAGRANENYAREIMELHTMGVDGGYTAQDIAELSRIFTGWHQSNGVFAFNDTLHDDGDKFFLGQTIVGSGVAEGEQVLDILSNHPSTAGFLCSKLITLFVSDQPVSTLQTQCSAEFLTTNGDISAVLRVIFGSEAFAGAENHRSKLKTPLEFVTSTIRGFDPQVSNSDAADELRAMGMNLFEFPAPTGFSEVAEDWLNSNAVIQRFRLANQAAEQVDMTAMMTALGLSSAEAIVSYMFELALGNEFTELEYQLALSILNDGSPFDFNANDADIKLKRLLGTVLSFPGYQYQ